MMIVIVELRTRYKQNVPFPLIIRLSFLLNKMDFCPKRTTQHYIRNANKRRNRFLKQIDLLKYNERVNFICLNSNRERKIGFRLAALFYVLDFRIFFI